LIERFNFYDVYGNFLPGLTFLALIWLPIGIVQQFWPGKEITSAIVALAFAYIAGHILQTVFGNALPSKGKDSKGRRRYPSDYFLDSDDSSFSSEFRRELQTAVMKAFHIDLNIGTPSDTELAETSRTRQDALRLARNALLNSDVQSYGQQFQGLYALMRGLAGAFWMGSAYMLGWSLSALTTHWLDCVTHVGWIGLLIALGTGFAMVFGNPKSRARMILDRVTLASILFALVSLGAWIGSHFTISEARQHTFLLISAASVWCGARSFSAYKHFAGEFARATWMDFLSHYSTSPSSAPPA